MNLKVGILPLFFMQLFLSHMFLSFRPGTHQERLLARFVFIEMAIHVLTRPLFDLQFSDE